MRETKSKGETVDLPEVVRYRTACVFLVLILIGAVVSFLILLRNYRGCARYVSDRKRVDLLQASDAKVPARLGSRQIGSSDAPYSRFSSLKTFRIKAQTTPVTAAIPVVVTGKGQNSGSKIIPMNRTDLRHPERFTSLSSALDLGEFAGWCDHTSYFYNRDPYSRRVTISTITNLDENGKNGTMKTLTTYDSDLVGPDPDELEFILHKPCYLLAYQNRIMEFIPLQPDARPFRFAHSDLNPADGSLLNLQVVQPSKSEYLLMASLGYPSRKNLIFNLNPLFSHRSGGSVDLPLMEVHPRIEMWNRTAFNAVWANSLGDVYKLNWSKEPDPGIHLENITKGEKKTLVLDDWKDDGYWRFEEAHVSHSELAVLKLTRRSEPVDGVRDLQVMYYFFFTADLEEYFKNPTSAPFFVKYHSISAKQSETQRLRIKQLYFSRPVRILKNENTYWVTLLDSLTPDDYDGVVIQLTPK